MNIIKLEAWHRDYNLAHKHTLDTIPQEPAVFALFGIVDNEPVNCRYVASTQNMQAAITQLFENPHTTGMKMFMQGPWIKLLQYQTFPGTPSGEMQRIVDEWIQQFKPSIDEEGEYNGAISQF